jgi:predicted GH43/DUF377 family glycosyl hydrolase
LRNTKKAARHVATGAGWIVLSHGGGAMRKYCVGALGLTLRTQAHKLFKSLESIMESSFLEI